jgi:hypothetical protein
MYLDTTTGTTLGKVIFNIDCYNGSRLTQSSVTSTTTMSASTWQHVAAVWTEGGGEGSAIKLYVNGVLESSGNTTATATSNAAGTTATITNGGTGYSNTAGNLPTVTVSGGACTTRPTATAVVTTTGATAGAISSITLTGAVACTVAPVLTISAPPALGCGMEATAVSTHIGHNNAASSGTTGYFKGKIDEVRFASVARSTNYISASYASQNNSLLTYNAAESYTTGSLSATNVQPASLLKDAAGNVTVSFTTTNTIPSDGKVVVTFPTSLGSGFTFNSG